MVVPGELWIQLKLLSYEMIAHSKFYSMMYYHIQNTYSSLITHFSDHSLKFQKFSSVLNFSNFTAMTLFFFSRSRYQRCFWAHRHDLPLNWCTIYQQFRKTALVQFRRQFNFGNSPLHDEEMAFSWKKMLKLWFELVSNVYPWPILPSSGSNLVSTKWALGNSQKKSPKLTVLKYWNKKLFLLKYFAGDH